MYTDYSFLVIPLGLQSISTKQSVDLHERAAEDPDYVHTLLTSHDALMGP